ncbi:hypothetical protein [Breoghania sp. L-A4]|uniref:hypothetical protein n=1 Tax=Breoghania sp. L-A4 TaxID=2304600 RepID=UPI000E35970D|nr:hypothetical protein [Breoghania sp. L-A4]AXS41576.1 hypothetical protein D1F64_18160 [Breoghania sp. L-A4]
MRTLPTRGLRIEMKQKAHAIVTDNDLPRIDIEINFAYDSADIERASHADLSALGTALSDPMLAHVRVALNGPHGCRGQRRL